MRDTFSRMQPKERGLFGDNETAPESPTKSARSHLVDIECDLRSDDPKLRAIGVTKAGSGADGEWQWLARSLIEYEKSGTKVRVTLPEWLAKGKGLI